VKRYGRGWMKFAFDRSSIGFNPFISD